MFRRIAPEEPPEQEPVKCDVDEEDCSGTPDYFEEEVTTVSGLASTAAATTTTTTTTTTTRPTTTTTTTTTRSTTTSTRKPLIPITSTAKPSAVSYPTNSPETIAALIALHNAFQESLKDREQEPGPKGQQAHNRYPQPERQQPSPKPFTVTNFQPPRHFPSKTPQPPPPSLPPYRHHQQPVLLSSERFGNQNFRHGFRLQNEPAPERVEPPPPPPPSQFQQQQYNGDGTQYDGSYDEGVAGYTGDSDVEDEESRRNFAREAPESSISVSVQVSSSSSKNSAINQQQRRPQQQLQPVTVATASTSTTAAAATTAGRHEGHPVPTTPKPPPSSAQPPPPVSGDDADSGDLYEDEYEELEGDEEFFKDVPKLDRNRKRRYAWRA